MLEKVEDKIEKKRLVVKHIRRVVKDSEI